MAPVAYLKRRRRRWGRLKDGEDFPRLAWNCLPALSALIYFARLLFYIDHAMAGNTCLYMSTYRCQRFRWRPFPRTCGCGGALPLSFYLIAACWRRRRGGRVMAPGNPKSHVGDLFFVGSTGASAATVVEQFLTRHRSAARAHRAGDPTALSTAERSVGVQA